MIRLAGLVVVASGLFLVGLGAVAFARPALARRFLESFASSARTHITEQLLRLVAGLALVAYSPRMWLPAAFEVFGWVIAGSAAALLLLPWRWHHAFGKWAIPLAVERLKLFGLGSLALGGVILYGAARGAFS